MAELPATAELAVKNFQDAKTCSDMNSAKIDCKTVQASANALIKPAKDALQKAKAEFMKVTRAKRPKLARSNASDDLGQATRARFDFALAQVGATSDHVGTTFENASADMPFVLDADE
eukprot:6976847-Pyramimonas_sp.AAC.1